MRPRLNAFDILDPFVDISSVEILLKGDMVIDTIKDVSTIPDDKDGD